MNSISAPRIGHKVKQAVFNRSYVTNKGYCILVIRPCYSTPRIPAIPKKKDRYRRIEKIMAAIYKKFNSISDDGRMFSNGMFKSIGYGSEFAYDTNNPSEYRQRMYPGIEGRKRSPDA